MTLLPCPFCGGVTDIFHGEGDTFWYAWCVQCDVSQSHYHYDTEKAAIEAWNNRVPAIGIMGSGYVPVHPSVFETEGES